MRWSVIVLLLSCFSCGTADRGSGPAAEGQARSVIFLIGDGLGVSHVSFARHFALAEGERFHFETLPWTALVSTSSTSPVTDSAASATAMSSGEKIDNKAIGMTPDGRALKSIADEALERGLKVGYVTNTTITHATPAGFYANVAHRYRDVDQIAIQLLEQAPHVALGGGYADFVPNSPELKGKRSDGRNLVEEARAQGYEVWRFGEDLGRETPDRLLGLFGESHLSYVLDDRRLPESIRSPALETLARVALASLSRDDADFFLMVEGGRIDHAGHNFDAAGVAEETAAFDRAVKVALDFQKEHPGTLVLVTADHATGGLAINDYADWELLRKQTASVDWMTEQILFEGGGVALVEEATGISLTEEEIEVVRAEFPEKYTAGRILGGLLAKRHGITWIPKAESRATAGHTGEDVPLYAGGPGAAVFQGVLDNTEIPARIRQALGWQ